MKWWWGGTSISVPNTGAVRSEEEGLSITAERDWMKDEVEEVERRREAARFLTLATV